MALTVSLSKVSVSEPQKGMKVLTVNMILLDGVEEMYNQNFVAVKKADISLLIVKERLRVEMQAAIDRYKREQQILESAALDNAIADIESALVG